ncbi:MAG: hypothetical protein JOY60_11350 [Burkholderiaceae bacterium]|nr:hypothetical protein [Roseateles sp.]MBV8470438.1 hypothetical protein [Burkholderiaceae bacterium]
MTAHDLYHLEALEHDDQRNVDASFSGVKLRSGKRIPVSRGGYERLKDVLRARLNAAPCRSVRGAAPSRP